MHPSKGTVVRRVSSVPPGSPGDCERERAIAAGSGVYEIRLRDERAEDTTVARDEFAGLDRLDREELDDDETPGPSPVGVVHDIGVTRRYRRSA